MAQAAPSPPVAVTVDSFPRAEPDLNFSIVVKDAGLGKFSHQRKPQALNKQTAAHAERDLSSAVFDLDARAGHDHLAGPRRAFPVDADRR